MPPAARTGDMTAHGTPLAGGGSPDVLIEGRPAWRAAIDVHTCPLASGPRPHGAGVVVTGSPTVRINGHEAVRAGDVIAESGPPNTVVAGAATVVIGAGATATEPSWAAALYDQLTTYVSAYNEAIRETDLGPAGRALASERVNVIVTTADGEAAFSFETDGTGRIEGVDRGPRDDASVRMETDPETVDRIAEASTPVTEFHRAVKDGDIAIRGIGRINRIKWRILTGVSDVLEIARAL